MQQFTLQQLADAIVTEKTTPRKRLVVKLDGEIGTASTPLRHRGPARVRIFHPRSTPDLAPQPYPLSYFQLDGWYEAAPLTDGESNTDTRLDTTDERVLRASRAEAAYADYVLNGGEMEPVPYLTLYVLRIPSWKQTGTHRRLALAAIEAAKLTAERAADDIQRDRDQLRWLMRDDTMPKRFRWSDEDEHQLRLGQRRYNIRVAAAKHRTTAGEALRRFPAARAEMQLALAEKARRRFQHEVARTTGLGRPGAAETRIWRSAFGSSYSDAEMQLVDARKRAQAQPFAKAGTVTAYRWHRGALVQV